MTKMTVSDGKRMTVGIEDKKTGIGFSPEKIRMTISKMTAELETKNRVGMEGDMLKVLGANGMAAMILGVGAVLGGVPVGMALAGMVAVAGAPILAGLLSRGPSEMEPAPVPRGVSLSREASPPVYNPQGRK